MDKCGIYKYTNKINGKIYIGQSINIYKRIREHQNAASNPNNKDFNLPIHKALRKYGIHNFDIVIIEECEKSQLNEREQYWIKYYNSYNKGYNATIGGQEGGYNGKEVEIYDLNGQYLYSYANAKIAAKEIGVSYSTLLQVLKMKRPTCKKFQAKYKEDQRIIGKFISKQGGTVPIIQYSLKGEQLKVWNSAAEASRSLNIDSSGITKCLKGKLQSTGGFKWKYLTKE